MHWQMMVILNASNEVKETEVLFFDSSIRGFDPRKNYHFHCDTGQETQEFEIDFLKRYLVSILTQERFLAAITTDNFTPSTATPEITFVNCVQQIDNDCALCVLKNMECCILKRTELTSGCMSRHFKVGIRTWYDIEDATNLRGLIVDMMLDLIRKLEMLEINNQTVTGSATEENRKDEVIELKIQESNNISVSTSDQMGKDKMTNNSSFANVKLEVKDSNDKLPIDDPSRRFNLIDYGLPGSFFSNRDLGISESRGLCQ